MILTDVRTADQISLLAKLACQVAVNLTGETISEKFIEDIFLGKNRYYSTVCYCRDSQDRMWFAIYHPSDENTVRLILSRFPDAVLYRTPELVANALVKFYISGSVSNCANLSLNDINRYLDESVIDELREQISELVIVRRLNNFDIQVVPSSHATC